MKLLKRLLSTILITALIILQIPITSLAVEPDVETEDSGMKNDGSGGGGANITNGKSVGDWANNHSRSGLRISIVDANDPTKVISVDSEGNPQVIDLIFCSEERFIQECGSIDGTIPSINYGRTAQAFSNVKTQELKPLLSDDANKIKQIFIPELLDKLKQSDLEAYTNIGGDELKDIQWMKEVSDGVYEGKGIALNKWFIINKNGEISKLFGNYTRVISETTNPDGEVEKVKEVVKTEPTSSDNSTSGSNKKSSTNKTNSTNKASNNKTEKTVVKKQIDYSLYNRYVANISKLASKYMNNSAYKTREEAYAKFTKSYGNYKKNIELYCEDGSLTPTLRDSLFKKLLAQDTKISTWAYKNVPGDQVFNDIQSFFGIMTAYAAEGDAVSPNSDEADKSEKNSALNNHLGSILDLIQDNEYLFKTPSTLETGKSLAEATEQWRVLVEPVDWFTPYNLGGTKPLWPYRFYGTISNIVDAMDLQGGVNAQLNNGKNEHLNRRTFNKVSWSAMTVSDDTSKKEEMFNHTYILDSPGSYGITKTNRQLADMNKKIPNKDEGNRIHQSGFAVQVYWVDNEVPIPTESLVITWDEEKYPDGIPGKAPDTSSDSEYPVETSWKELSKKFNIAKWYYFEYEDTNEEEIFDVKVRENTPHAVEIINEGSYDTKYYWRVDKWATGTKKILPNDGDTSQTYEEFCKSNEGSYIGDTANILTLDPTDPDQVLYVKLVLTILPTRPTVVKVYETNGATDKVDVEENVKIDNNRYKIEEADGEYKYVESVVSHTINEEEINTWQDVPKQEGTKTETVLDIDENVNYVYIKYEKTDTHIDGDTNQLTLHEDELSYPYNMGSLKDQLDEIWYSFEDKSKNGSGSHSSGSGPNKSSWSCSWNRYLSNDDYNISVKNTYDYGATTFIGSAGIFAGSETGKISTSDSERSASITGFDTEHLIPNWQFNVYRDKSKDKVTLYPGKNSTEVTNDLSLIGIDKTSYIPDNRIAKENGGSFKNTFSIKYVYENLDDKLTWSSTGCSRHGDSGSYNGTPNEYIDILNSNYNATDNILTKYYLGKANEGMTVPGTTSSPFSIDGKTYNINCKVFQKDRVIKFYPMIKMNYQTHTKGKTQVYVTSTNESSVLAPTRIETGVYRSLNGKPNLNLSSNQWSTHSKTQNYLTEAGIADKNSVLPGGALYSLDADAEGRETWLGIRAWQTVIEDNQLESLPEKEGVLTKSQADSDWENFKNTSKDVLEHYQVVQYVAPGISKNLQEFNKATGKVLVSGAGQVSQLGGNTLDRSGKYYLKVDGSGADRADIDILADQEQVNVYKVLSDTDGNVLVLRDGVEIGRISKTQGASELNKIPEIKELDDKTKIISNYISGIDRTKGSNRDGETWYNEAFDGIEVVYHQWAIKLGFGNGQEVRSSALDPKLTGKLTERRDVYNFDNGSLKEKTRTSLFQISNYSTSSKASGKATGYIGSLDGLDIRNNMSSSMYSKLFYIPNANVTDLN